MFIAKEIRKQARQLLQGNYWKIFLVTLLGAIFTTGISVMVNIFTRNGYSAQASWSNILSILGYFFTAAATGVLLQFVRGQLDENFQPFERWLHFLKSPYFMPILLTGVMVFVYTLLWAIPFIVGTVLMIVGVAGLYAHGGSVFGLFVFIGIGVMLVGLVIIIWKPIRYLFAVNATFDLVDQNGSLQSASQAVDSSKELMEGHVWDFIRLNLSFIGWYILAMVTFGVGLIFLIPYTSLANVLFYERLVQEK
ncbi:MAG: DUF975 family protein [Streptococcaceae bacterium]|jgi:uncharacterized membrane protein|nr:DUF975 family protein [Streptococcaceae bacterium]